MMWQENSGLFFCGRIPRPFFFSRLLRQASEVTDDEMIPDNPVIKKDTFKVNLRF